MHSRASLCGRTGVRQSAFVGVVLLTHALVPVTLLRERTSSGSDTYPLLRRVEAVSPAGQSVADEYDQHGSEYERDADDQLGHF
jgi:hypothetical protein